VKIDGRCHCGQIEFEAKPTSLRRAFATSWIARRSPDGAPLGAIFP
jgi:hypothetical protein